MPLRCDHCDAMLDASPIERECKRFCCSECAKAFYQDELKAISRHVHLDQDVALAPTR